MQAIDSTRLTGGALLLGLALAWGNNWSMIAIALAEIPIWQYRATSALIAGVSLLAIAVAMGQPVRVPRGQWRPIVIAATFYISAWLVLIGYGVILMKTGQAAMLAFTMPLWVALLGALVLGERIDRRRGAALVLGMAGIAVLVTQDFAAMGSSPWGVACVLGAAIGWAVGTVALKHVRWTVPTLTLAGWQFILGSVPLFVIALATEEVTIHRASTAALAAYAYNTFIAFVFAYMAWFTAVRMLSVGAAAIGTLLVPAVALGSTALILGDVLTVREIVALVLLCAGVGLVITRPPAKPEPG